MGKKGREWERQGRTERRKEARETVPDGRELKSWEDEGRTHTNIYIYIDIDIIF